MTKIAIFLTLLCLVTSGISEYLVLNDTQNEKCKEIEKRDQATINSNAYLRKKYDICQKKFQDTNSKATFSTFSFIECFCIINSIFFCQIKNRISLGVDFGRPNEEEVKAPNEFKAQSPELVNPQYPQTQVIPYQLENGIPQNAVIIFQPQQMYTYQQNVNVYQNSNNQNEKANNVIRNQIRHNSKKITKKQKNISGSKTTIDNNQNSVQSNIMMSSQRNIQGKFI